MPYTPPGAFEAEHAPRTHRFAPFDQRSSLRFVGIFLIICSIPVFLWALRSVPNARRWAAIALGALPILDYGYNLNAAFIDWSGWPGHTRGMIVSLTDTLALAICMSGLNKGRQPLLFWVWLVYILCSVPGAFVGNLFTPSLFYLFSLVKAIVYFQACYVVFKRGDLDHFITGLSLTIILNGGITLMNGLGGAAQASGILGHRNYSGMISNMAIPVILVAGTLGRLKPIPLLAVIMSAVAAILGGSRAVIMLFGVTVLLTLLAAMWARPSKQITSVLALCLVGSLLFVPFAVGKIDERLAQSNSEFSLSKDAEREAFERAAGMMNEDFPLGVGLNQYAVTANSGGYSEAAGVTWSTASRSATVHNSYVLVRTEGGQIALVGMLLLIGATLFTATKYLIRRRSNPERLFAAPVFVTVLVLSVHISFEWGFVAMNTLYSFAFISAVASYVSQAARTAKVQQAQKSLRARQAQVLAET